MRRRAGALPIVGVLAMPGVLVPMSSGAGGGGSETCTETHVRHVDAYYGTGKVLDADGNVVASVDDLELTDHVSENLATQIEATYGDARVTSRIDSWVDTSDDQAWTLGTSEGLDAEGNLAAALDPTNLTSGPIASTTDTGNVYRGTESYYLTTWLDTGECNGLPSRLIAHDGFGEVSYYERTMTATLAPSPVQPRTTG